MSSATETVFGRPGRAAAVRIEEPYYAKIHAETPDGYMTALAGLPFAIHTVRFNPDDASPTRAKEDACVKELGYDECEPGDFDESFIFHRDFVDVCKFMTDFAKFREVMTQHFEKVGWPNSDEMCYESMDDFISDTIRDDEEDTARRSVFTDLPCDAGDGYGLHKSPIVQAPLLKFLQPTNLNFWLACSHQAENLVDMG